MTPQQIEALKLALEALEDLTDCGAEAWSEERPCVRIGREAIAAIKEALAQPEQEPVAWLLTDKNINSLQVDSIQRLIDRLKHAHHTDIRVRINGHDEWFEADWLKHMVRVTPPQPEQNPMSDEMLQAITDPENQPSQYGTVTLDYHFEKIKKWEDLFERMSNKVLQQLEQEPVAWMDADGNVSDNNDHKCFPIPLYTTPPQQEPVISKWVLREVYFDEDGEPIMHRSTPQPERHELQAKGEHPAPCARHCEANAFQIVIKNLKAQLAQPEQEEKLPPVEIGVDVTDIGTTVVAFYRRPNAVMEMFYSQFHPLAQPEQEPFCLHWEDRWGCNHYADPKEPHPVNAKPLYTTPPHRKPLTQDGTMEIANQTAGQYWMDEAHIQRFRAAVEAAHGIKE